MWAFLNQSGIDVKPAKKPAWDSDLNHHGKHHAEVGKRVKPKRSVTRIGPKRPFRLFIAEWRETKGLTQEKLGDRLGCTSVTVSRWETGTRQPNLDAQAAIAEALGIDPFDLRRHPDQPSADALLRDQPQEVRDQAIKLIQAIRR